MIIPHNSRVWDKFYQGAEKLVFVLMDESITRKRTIDGIHDHINY